MEEQLICDEWWEVVKQVDTPRAMEREGVAASGDNLRQLGGKPRVKQRVQINRGRVRGATKSNEAPRGTTAVSAYLSNTLGHRVLTGIATRGGAATSASGF